MDFTVFPSSRLEMAANLVAYSRASKEFSLLEEIFFPRARNDRIFLEDSSKDSLIVTSLRATDISTRATIHAQPYHLERIFVGSG